MKSRKYSYTHVNEISDAFNFRAREHCLKWAFIRGERSVRLDIKFGKLFIWGNVANQELLYLHA